MSWDSTYSFGTPNAQPPTPTKTPTSGAFPSPTFQTPRNNNSSFDNRSGWTPTFAEEYSVFNATPGRLTAQNPFVETPRPPTERRRLASTGDISNELATHVHHLSPNLSHPVDPSNQLHSSTGLNSSSRSRFDDSSTKVTPQKPKKRLDEAFSGQTATPPNTASKGTRRLAPKLSTTTMQHDSQNSQYGASATPTQQPMMQFPATSTDLFGHPMSAPATAPVFNTNSFWDPDTNMGGMDMDFTPESAVFNPSSHRVSNSFDWGRNNQLFQDTVNMPQPQPREAPPQPAKRQRPLAPKVSLPLVPTTQPTSLAPFEFGSSPTSDDPFAVTSTGGIVNPGLLLSHHGHATSMSDGFLSAGFEDAMLPQTRPATSQVILEPYQHQRRESRRDQEELRRSRSTRENGSFRFDKARGTVSSPVKGSARLGLQRSVSDSRGKRPQGKRQMLPAAKIISSDNRAPPRGGRSSPVKHSTLTNLHSIPESPDRRPRTEVKFTIDSNGRAKTETVLVVDEPQPRLARKRGSPSAHGEDWGSSSYESSSDDEPIIIPSQNNSFAFPAQRQSSKLARFETSHGFPDGQRSSASGSSYNQSESSRHSSQHDGHDSEAETVMDEEDGTGDATRELRKVMESRKQSKMKSSQNPRHHHYSDARAQYASYGSSAASPATVTDPEGATPSSSRSGTTRCVCNKADSEGFMIQCESCDNWLHAQCVGIDRRSLPPVYICAFCANTPNNIRGIRKAARGPNLSASPLAHKSFQSFR